MTILCNGIFTFQETTVHPTLLLAATELNRLVQKRTGSNEESGLTCPFQVADVFEGYSCSVEGKTLLFTAPTEVEILYAVYEFAEVAMGYTFALFDEERHAQTGVFSLREGALFVKRRPLLKRRGFIQEFDFNNESRALADYMAKNRLNYLLTWMKYYDQLPAEDREYFAIRGIEIESGHHNFDYWIPFAKYMNSHPEFFALINGKRVKLEPGEDALLLSKQLCTTNPALRAEIVKNMVEYCRNHPELHTISLIPNDGFGWCECENCSKFYDVNAKGELYSVSDHVYKADRIYHDLIQYVVREFRKELPDVNITFCAYVNYSAPASDFKLEPGMAVHFAPYWRCINHAIFDSDCPINSRYAQDLDQWITAKAGGEVNLYEYFMGVNLYLSLPMIHFDLMFEEISYYAAKGVDGILTQFHPPHWTSYGLNFLFMAKAAYGEGAEAIDTVFAKLYGAEAKEARAFYRDVRSLMVEMGKCHIPYPYSIFRRTTQAGFEELKAKAELLTSTAPADRHRKELVILFDYVLRFKKLFDAYHTAHTCTIEDIEAFRSWVHTHRDTRCFVHPKIDMYLDAWVEALKTNRSFLHFNIDWEDECIRRHTALLQ